jgi:molecular chaperone GrpE
MSEEIQKEEVTATDNQQNIAPVQDDRTQQLEAEVADLKDKYLRTLADMDNLRKRVAKERADLIKYQGDRIIFDLLDVVDNLERALASAETDVASLKEGVPLVYKGFIDTLAKWEIKSEPSLGKAFDPAKHKALSQVPVDDAAPGTIINEFRKTYFYRDKLLRAGEVVVAAAKSAE